MIDLYYITVTVPARQLSTHIQTVARVIHRELLEVESGRAEIIQAIEAVIAWTEANAPDGKAGDPADEWDAIYDEMRADLDHACDLDASGVLYTLPDGRVIEASALEINTAGLDELTRGYITAALWADCWPADPEIKQIQPNLWIVRDERNGETQHVSREGAEAEHARRHDNAESGGCEHLEPTAELREMFRLDCAAFAVAAGDDLLAYVQARVNGERANDASQGTPLDYAGHDLWLSSRGHGTGFWDRGLGDLGDRLHEASKVVSSDACPVDSGDGTAGLL